LVEILESISFVDFGKPTSVEELREQFYEKVV